MSLTDTDRRQLQFAGLAAVIVVLLASGVYILAQAPSRIITAYFRSAAAVFEDNSVRVLGVPVGSITEVVPEGTRVRVEMRIDDPDLRLPADAHAVVVSPSLVTGRYIQLAPTYSGGPELTDGGVIPVERTAVPLGVDELYRTATELADALGPHGANARGALSDALDVGAANLAGNGKALNDTIRNLGELSGTLADSREDLFGTVTELQKFTSMLAANDAQVREFNTRLESVAGFLAAERGDLATAVRELSIALDDVARFIRDNRELVRSNVDKLKDVTEVLVRQKKALAETLDVGPTALSNLALAGNSSSGTLDTRALFNELAMPAPVLACELVRRAGGDLLESLDPVTRAACNRLAALPLPSTADVLTALQSGQPPPLPGLALPTAPAPQGGADRTAAPPAAPSLPSLQGALPGAGERPERPSEPSESGADDEESEGDG